MPDTPDNFSPLLPDPPAALQRLDGPRESRSHATDAHGNTPDDAVPDTDSADTQGPKPIDYAKQFVDMASAVLSGAILPSQAQAAANCLRSSYEVLYASSRAQARPSSAGTASSDPSKSDGTVTPGTRTASEEQMRTIIDVILDYAPDQLAAIEPMLTEADRGYVQARFTSVSPQEPS